MPEGQEIYNRHVFYQRSAADPAKDELIFGEGRGAEDMAHMSDYPNDGRWLLITVLQGWTKAEMYLQDLKAALRQFELTRRKGISLQRRHLRRQDLHHHQRRCAAISHVSRSTRQLRARTNWKEIIPQSDAVLQGASIVDGKLFGAV